jgi:SAM-dependent methyltransferase
MYCNSLERHRLVWLYFERMTNLFDGVPKKMLHVAPEPMLQGLLKERLGSGYLTGDLFSPAAMVRMDITDIQYGAEEFDVIYCSHVLEHVSDDRRAMREFWRVLNPHGWAVLLVPMGTGRTFEDPSVTDPAERARLFGQEDHVRAYGPDYVDRLGEAGFQVRVTKPADFLSAREIVHMGITDAAGEVYCCTK